MALNFAGLEDREVQKDKQKNALEVQLASNKEWDRRQLQTSRMGLKNKLVEMALERSFIGTNGMVSGNGKDSETGMTNFEAREALIRNYKVENDKGEMVDDDKFLAAISRIDGTKDPQGFIKLYRVLNPYITAMKKDSMDRTFMGDEVRRGVIDLVNRASIVGPDLDRPGKIIANIEDNILKSKLDERTKRMLQTGIPTEGSFNITEELIYANKPKVEEITEFENFVIRPVRSRAEAEKMKILSLVGEFAQSEEKEIMGPDGKPLTEEEKTELQAWYNKRLGDITRAIDFAEKEKNPGLLAGLYSSQFLYKAQDFYGNMDRAKELINPAILNSGKTPIFVPNEKTAVILKNAGILLPGDILYLIDIKQQKQIPKQ
tara:strand:+ start:9537 stop:10661 length:1125 start_codon:yes stop_codon:yes gene_type:complete